MNEPWYLLYYGESEGKEGTSEFLGRTTHKIAALNHFLHLQDNPEISGHVLIIANRKILQATKREELE